MLKSGDKVFLYEIEKKERFKNIELDKDLDSLLDYGFGQENAGIEKRISHEEYYYNFYNLREFTIDTIMNGNAVLKENNYKWFPVWKLRDKLGNRLICTTEEYRKYENLVIR